MNATINGRQGVTGAARFEPADRSSESKWFDAYIKRREEAGEEDAGLSGAAGNLAVDSTAARAVGARAGADDHQPGVGAGAALFDEVPGGQRHHEASDVAATLHSWRRPERDANPGTDVVLVDSNAFEGGAEADC